MPRDGGCLDPLMATILCDHIEQNLCVKVEGGLAQFYGNFAKQQPANVSAQTKGGIASNRSLNRIE